VDWVAGGPLLCPFFLPTGNFAKSRLWERRRLQSNAVITGRPTQIPYSTKQGIIFAGNRGSGRENRESYRSKSKLSLDQILGAKKKPWMMSAVTPKADIDGPLWHVSAKRQ